MSANTGITLNCLPYASKCSRDSPDLADTQVPFRAETNVAVEPVRKRLNPSFSKQPVGLVVLLGCQGRWVVADNDAHWRDPPSSGERTIARRPPYPMAHSSMSVRRRDLHRRFPDRGVFGVRRPLRGARLEARRRDRSGRIHGLVALAHRRGACASRGVTVEPAARPGRKMGSEVFAVPLDDETRRASYVIRKYAHGDVSPRWSTSPPNVVRMR
jgi:hypothetical protein